MKTLYFDCFSGVSGDMTIGALIDLGVDFEQLKKELQKLHLNGYTLSAGKVSRALVSGTKFDVDVDSSSHPDTVSHQENSHNHHSNSHDQHHIHTHEHSHEHSHDRHTHHEQQHSDSHDHSYHHQSRGLKQINEIIEASHLSDWVKQKSKEIFYRLAVAEGHVHAISPYEVHFHEVGAVDAIVDIVGACIGFEMLGIEHFISSPLHVGYGFVKCAHGRYPVPGPGTMELLKGVPIYSKGIEGELVTPTGAAIVTTLCSEYTRLPEFTLEAIGYGAGSRDIPDFPNMLRLVTGEIKDEKKKLHHH